MPNGINTARTGRIATGGSHASGSSAWLRRGAALMALTVSVMCAVAVPSRGGAGAAGPSTVHPAAAGAALSVSPAAGLADGQTVSVVITGASPGSTYVAVECDPTAYTLLAKGESPSDGCDSRHDAVFSVDAGGTAATTLQPQAVITSALGAAHCLSVQCFVAVESLHSTGGPALLVANITFSPSACAKSKACTTPDDAWDPSLNSASRSGTIVSAVTHPTLTAPPSKRRPSATPGSPVVLSLTAGQAGDLNGPGAITGPYSAPFTVPVVGHSPVAGEGLLRLALSAPRTAWGAKRPSSTVVDVTVVDATTSTPMGTQEFVLFDGAGDFTYAGFVGPVTTTDSYQVTVAAEASHLSGGQSWPKGTDTPTATVVDSQLLDVKAGAVFRAPERDYAALEHGAARVAHRLLDGLLALFGP